MKGIKINIPTSRKIVSFFFNYRVGFIVAFIVTISVYWLINNQERKEITLYADTFMLKDPYVEIDIFLNKKGEKVYLRDTSNIYIIPRYKDLIRFHVSGVPLHTQDNIFNIGQYIKHADTTTYDGEMPLDKRLWHSKVISDEYIKCDMFITGDWFLAPRFSDGLIRGITPDTMYSEYSVGIKNYSDDIKKTDVLIEDYNSNSDYNLIGENELYDEYFESRVEEKVYYNIQENGYCSDIILPERGYRSLNVKLKPKTEHHISKDIYYIER